MSKNYIPLGGLFKLKNTVVIEEIIALGYSYITADWMLKQESFRKSNSSRLESLDKIYFPNHKTKCISFFKLDMVEPFEKVKKDRNHLLTSMFK